MFTRKHLRKWWNRALRRRVLYKVLDQYDRSYLFLTIKVLDKVRSVRVGAIIVKILMRLKAAMKSSFVRRMETYGVEKAWMLSAVAVKWGQDEAGGWARDKGFARYLTVLDLNSPSGWGV